MAISAQHIRAAQTQLKKNDQRMREIIREVGPFTLRPKRHHFQTLASSIISQQISTSAAQTILHRLHDHLQPHGWEAQAIAGLDLETLRTLGVSRQKGSYLLDLAEHVSSGKLDLKTVSRKSDEAVIEALTAVKGIGVWTAQMFLIFSLGRLDVLPVADFGIRKAIQIEYGLDDLPTPSEITEIAQPWRPYATVASWYLWRTLDKPASA
ncbi:MAG: DNA-3-methyladenine glycosylase family protein [Planctomycetota bacterium]|nr:DNA-3-methyladenine glycosylase [Blastopirellula sp.]